MSRHFVSFSSDKVESLLSNLDSRLCNRSRRHQPTCPKNLLLCSSSPSLCSIHPLICSRSSAICLEISKHYCSAQKGAKTDPCNLRPISLLPARLWNPSSLQTLNLSSSPMAWFPIINLVSDQVTLRWICCFCSPNNRWRYSMPDMKLEPYP